jgi:hypothetical protein
MRLTGKDVWEAGVKMGWASGPYDPRSSLLSARADKMASLLNEVLSKRQNWLPELLETEDSMRAWEARTPREKVLRLYKFLNQLGYTASCLTGNAYSNFTSAGIVVASTFWLTGAGSEPLTRAPVDSKIKRFTCSLRHSCTRRCSVRSCAPVG